MRLRKTQSRQDIKQHESLREIHNIDEDNSHLDDVTETPDQRYSISSSPSNTKDIIRIKRSKKLKTAHRTSIQRAKKKPKSTPKQDDDLTETEAQNKIAEPEAEEDAAHLLNDNDESQIKDHNASHTESPTDHDDESDTEVKSRTQTNLNPLLERKSTKKRRLIPALKKLLNEKKLRLEETNFTKLPGWPGEFSRDKNAHKFFEMLETFFLVNQIPPTDWVNCLMIANIANSAITKLIIGGLRENKTYLQIKEEFLRVTSPFGLQQLRKDFENIQQTGSIEEYVDEYQNFITILDLEENDPQVATHFLCHLDSYYRSQVEQSRIQQELILGKEITSTTVLMHMALRITKALTTTNSQPPVRCVICRSKFYSEETLGNLPSSAYVYLQ